MARLIWLSFPLGMEDPRPPAIPAPSLEALYTVPRDGANVQILRAANHTGTHVDAPRHVIEDGLTLHDFEPAEFLFFRPAVIDLVLDDGGIVAPQHLEPLARWMESADLLLFRFGAGEIRRCEPARYAERCPGFGVESARWIRERFPDLRAVGMDVPSLACIASLEQTMAAHHELLGGVGRRFLVIEDMNLEPDLSALREVRLNPWLVAGMDSGPCSVVGVLE